MSELEDAIEHLRKFFTPKPEYSHDTVAWEPLAGDTQGGFKRDLISKAKEILAAGEATLSGTPPEEIGFGDYGADIVEKNLSDDPDESVYLELSSACEHVVHAIKAGKI